MFNPLQIPVRILRTLILGHEASAELAHINASTQRWLDEQTVTADTLELEDQLSAARDELHHCWSSGTDVNVKLAAVERELAQRTNERDAARADVVRLTTEHDARDDEALKWTSIAGRAAEEIEQLRADLAHARNQLPGTPGTGDTISLRFENGSTVTGPLYLNWENRPMVRGWYADVEGRTRVPALDGGEA